MRILNLIGILILLSGPLAQAQIYTEAEVNLEKMLIDASREKFLKNYDKAIAILEKAQELVPEDAAVAFELGKLYGEIGDNNKAEKMLRIAVQEGGDNEWYYKSLLDLYRQTGQYEKALSLCEQLVEKKPHTKDYYFDLAWYNTVLNKFSKAIKVYDRMESKFGYSEQIATRKHRLFLVSGDKKKAEKEYLKLVGAFPENVNHRFLLAGFYENQGEQAKAAVGLSCCTGS